ncbi:hypothetical protein CN09_12810 [Rhizobium rhizogenes]|nr:hypothetical protein CN09_12810 [Rhizobium rhizogenes]
MTTTPLHIPSTTLGIISMPQGKQDARTTVKLNTSIKVKRKGVKGRKGDVKLLKIIDLMVKLMTLTTK